ncbi:MAG: hypothetical protein WCN95_12060, partial [bacterium]
CCSHVGRQLAADANGKKLFALDRASPFVRLRRDRQARFLHGKHRTMRLDCCCSHVGRQLAADANGKKLFALKRASTIVRLRRDW